MSAAPDPVVEEDLSERRLKLAMLNVFALHGYTAMRTLVAKIERELGREYPKAAASEGWIV